MGGVTCNRRLGNCQEDHRCKPTGKRRGMGAVTWPIVRFRRAYVDDHAREVKYSEPPHPHTFPEPWREPAVAPVTEISRTTFISTDNSGKVEPVPVRFDEPTEEQREVAEMPIRQPRRGRRANPLLLLSLLAGIGIGEDR